MVVAMHLLEGLVRCPDAAKKVVDEAIERHEAAKRLARAISCSRAAVPIVSPPRKRQRIDMTAKTKDEESEKIIDEKRKQSMRESNTSENNKNTFYRAPIIPSFLSSPSWQHWLFQALSQSPMLSVRQLAARILHSSAPPDRLRAVLMDMLLMMESTRGDIQVFGLLIESLRGNKNSKGDNEDNEVIVSSGLRWASKLLHCEVTQQNQVRNCFGGGKISTNNHQKRHRTFLLIHWLHELLYQSKYALLYQKQLWSSTSDLNPLSNMICAHAILSRQPLRLEPIVKMLGQLVDPAGARKPPSKAKAKKSKPSNTTSKSTTATSNKSNATNNNESSDSAPSGRNDIPEENNEDVDMESQPNHDEDEDEDEDDDDNDDDDDDDAAEGGEIIEEHYDDEEIEEEEVEGDEEKPDVYDMDTEKSEEECYGEVEEEEDEDGDLSESEEQQQQEEQEEDQEENDDEEEEDDDEEEEEDDDEDENNEDEEDEENEDDEGMEVDEVVEDDGDQEITEAEQEIVDVVRHFEERLLEINDNDTSELHPSSSAGPNTSTIPEANTSELATTTMKDRKQVYLKATLKVLNDQYPAFSEKNAGGFLSPSAEHYLWQSICNVIRPPKKPLNLKIFMRRAPTQEEFFRGSLSRNPVHLSNVAAATDVANNHEPTARHLRQYIADQLQMSETAELIELLCANKILNLDLKLRVIHQVLWKNHLMENSSSSVFSSLISGGGAPTFFSTGSGLSMVLSTERRNSSGSSNITANTPASALPPMVITYRLAGVDGEATEDIIEDLNDPEAPSKTLSPEEQERLMENEFGLTRLVTEDRGIQVLLRSIQSSIRDSLRRIRRDDVVWKRSGRGKRLEKNLSLVKFEKSAPFAGLMLMKHCTKLPSNRKKLVDARTPTILLRMLLDVLNTIDDSSTSSTEVENTSSDQNAQIVSNPTAVMLEELIETLASDISTDDDATEDDMDIDQGSSTLPLLLSSLKTIYLGPQLRKVIAKLLPFLTYGQSSLARELAENFERHIKVEKLSDCEAKEQPKTRRFVLMDTFVQAAVCLPPNDVCNSLRSEFLKCGFVEKLISFVLEDMPDQPPPWSAALWQKKDQSKGKASNDVSDLEQSWKYYFLRTGIKTAIDMLVGLCRGHSGLQSLIAQYGKENRFVRACHWMESTSDNKSVRIYLNGLGLLAETLLDEVKENNSEVAKIIGAIRRKTRERKKEIADERRNKALNAFGPVTGDSGEVQQRPYDGSVSSTIRSAFLAPVLGLFGQGGSGKPNWLAEMEALEDETGLTCAVCQEGRTLQPSELLGLYCYVKKVSIPVNKCGGRAFIEGAMLLMVLPDSLPTSLVNTPLENYWYNSAKSVGVSLQASNSISSSSSANRKSTQVTTTVSAGNAIHWSCHSKARSADRNHPKAPKSEWEGAKLRNARVSCNVILPLVSSKSSKVPLVAVDMALTDYQSAIGNLLGARPKAMLWAVLNDVRLLLLRIAYGEALNVDCGGGSMSSNAALMFYQLLLADMFTNDAEHDSPETARHAKSLSGGFLAAVNILKADDYESSEKTPSLNRCIADAATMAALTCILYHNTKDEEAEEPEKDAKTPHPKRRWELNKEDFLCGLIICAGRRHALGVDESGCVAPSRKGKRSSRQSAFSDWEIVGEDDDTEAVIAEPTSKKPTQRKAPTSVMGKHGLLPKIDDFALALRPMITFYAILDAVSSLYVQNMTDEMVEESSVFLVKRIKECQETKSITELLRKAGVTLDNFRILEELQKGMMAA